MDVPLKLVRIGDATGVILLEELLALIGARRGDTVTASGSNDAIALRPLASEHDQQMGVARAVMVRRAQALRELAK